MSDVKLVLGVIARNDEPMEGQAGWVMNDTAIMEPLLVQSGGVWNLTRQGQQLVQGMQALLHQIIKNRFEDHVSARSVQPIRLSTADGLTSVLLLTPTGVYLVRVRAPSISNRLATGQRGRS